MDSILHKEYWGDDKGKPKVKSAGTQESSIYVKGLHGNSFVVDTPNVSFKIVDEMGFQKGHYILNNIVSFDLIDDKIIIHTSDEVKITYVFTSKIEAEQANEKLNNIINGL